MMNYWQNVLAMIEGMAACEDAGVQTLLQVEVLEVVFGLPYQIYIEVERKMMQPATKRLHEANKPFFFEPEPPKNGKELGRYRTRAEKKDAKKFYKKKRKMENDKK